MKKFNMTDQITADFTKSKVGFHGDVVLIKEKLPKNFESMKKIEDDCLAYGEATGHMHKCFSEEGGFDLRLCETTQVKYLSVIMPTTIRHQEHRPTIVPPGTYKIGIQREYDPFSKRIRAVVD